MASPSQVLQSQSEPSMSTSTDEIVIKDETKEEELDDIHDVMDPGSVATVSWKCSITVKYVSFPEEILQSSF